MLMVPNAERRAALLDRLEALVRAAGPVQLLSPPVAPETLFAAFATGGTPRVAEAAFRIAGMPEPEVEILGGNGAATAFRSHGRVIVRAGGVLHAHEAVASVIRAACAIWRQARELLPAACEDEEVATSVYLSLGAAEASAAVARAQGRAEALVFAVAAQSVARGDPHATATVAWNLNAPLDVLYEDALRVLAPRGDELRARFRSDEARLPEPVEIIGTRVVEVDSWDRIDGALAAQPCPCGGRWRIARTAPELVEGDTKRLEVACRVCLRWRDVVFRATGRLSE